MPVLGCSSLEESYPSESLFSILLDIYLGVELLVYIVILCLAFKEMELFATVAVLFYISTNNALGFQFLTTLVIFLLLYTYIIL